MLVSRNPRPKCFAVGREDKGASRIGYITDLPTVMRYDVMSLPALVIDDQIVSMGKVLRPSEIRKLLGF